MTRAPLLLAVSVAVFSGVACPNEVATGGDCKPGQSPAECRRDKEGPSEAPSLYVDPPFGVGFDCIVLGCDVEKTLVVSNRGGGTLRVSLIRLSVDSSTDFTLRRTDDEPLPTPDDPLKLDAGEQLEIAVRYVPSDATHDSGELVFESSDGDEPYDDTVSRTDEIPVVSRSLGDAVATLGTDDLDFGYVVVGDSATLSVRVSHGGTQNVLEIGPITLDETASQDFHPPRAEDWQVRYLNPGDEALIPVVFSPTTPDAAFGAIAILTSDPVYPLLRVDLRGTAIAEPRVRIVDPGSGPIDVGSVRSGDTRTRPLTVMNLGGAPLDVSAVISAGAELGLSVGAAPQPTLGALQQTTFEVTLTAGIGGEVVGAVDVQSNDPATPVLTVPIEGDVTAPVLTATPPSLDFGNIVLGWTAPSQTITLDNTGVGDLTITGIAFDVGSSPLVHLANVPDLPLKLSPDEEPVTISVYVEAQQLGRTDAVLLLTSDSVEDDVIRLDIFGNVVTCEEGCPIANGVPDCSTGSCQVGDCVPSYHDADGSAGNGCECGEDQPSEVGDNCANVRDLGDYDDCGSNPGNLHVYGTVHDVDDVDVFYFQVTDTSSFPTCDATGDSSETSATLHSAPNGLALCGVIQSRSSPCTTPTGPVYDPSRCLVFNGSSVRIRHDGGYGNDDDRSMTVWLVWSPDSAPVCANYHVEIRGEN